MTGHRKLFAFGATLAYLLALAEIAGRLALPVELASGLAWAGVGALLAMVSGNAAEHVAKAIAERGRAR